MKRKMWILIGIGITLVAGGLTWLMNRPTASVNTWPLNQPDAVYTIHGIENYDRGATYYVYREYEGKRNVVKVDPASDVELVNLTDKPVKLAGYFTTSKTGETLLRVTFVELVNK